MSFCYECGENLGGKNAQECDSCGWSLTIELDKKIPKGKRACPDCGKRGKSLRECGICREAWFCSWCHQQRTAGLRKKSKVQLLFTSKYSEKLRMMFPDDEDYYFGEFWLFQELLEEIKRYEPCLECSIKYIESKFDKWSNPKIPLGDEKQISFVKERHREKLLEELADYRTLVMEMCGFSKESLTSNPLGD